jgi:SHS2 domain-containing protein
MSAPRWEHFEHEADIGVRGYDDSVAEAFKQAALAFSSVITELDKIEPTTCLSVECEAPDYDVLLVDWLNELVYQMAIERMLFSTFNVVISGFYLEAEICGEQASQQKHQPAVEIKGATFTELKVFQNSNDEWVAQCIVDV